MKKLAASILLLIYFVVNTGFVVSVHYCMNEVNNVKFGHSTNDECGKCGMPVEDNNGCCKDEVKVVKMHADQTVAKLAIADFSLQTISFKVSEYQFTSLFTEIEQAEPVANGPPLSQQDTYLQNCVFRI